MQRRKQVGRGQGRGVDALQPEPKHGLGAGAVTLTVQYKDGDKPATKTLTVGAPTAPGAPTRFARAGDGPVYVVSDTVAIEADKPALARLTKNVLSLDPESLSKVVVTGPTPDDGLTLVKADGKWKVEGARFEPDAPAVTALVLHAAHRIGTRALRNGWMWCLAAASFVAIFAFAVPFPAIVLAAGTIGYVGARRWPAVFALGGGHSSHHQGYGPALIDDTTPTPEHARFSRKHLAKVLAAGLALWLVAMGTLVATQGWQGTLTQMGWFFSKAALVTFGGAYAVLPYVYQGAVEHYHWLSGPQMIDGLALGETTPGPLIMVVAFVGFVGGWLQQVWGPDALFAGAAAAATVVTFVTFLPSFIFILAGGPAVEATHGKLGFTAPLSAITAAVVGVILNLALFFAYHLLWPQGFGGRFDAVSALIAVGALVALFFFRLGVVPLLALCAAMGLGATLIPQWLA